MLSTMAIVSRDIWAKGVEQPCQIKHDKYVFVCEKYEAVQEVFIGNLKVSMK